ncbi:Olfactomedin Olfactory mucus protein [Collichthys lucidus]|uniref:Olfactomedin Olfactory mucus protein n=1 Tax=Collichthys lucidus TaxID=240159 RepID=A0A4U5UFP1_COLLU|nr:Olfactomedin Olfactory mucus protein [Collichthys lucidus]
MLLLLLLLLPSADGQTRRVTGEKKADSCECAVDPDLWSFPAGKYEAVLQKVQSCEVSLNSLQEQVNLSSQRLPDIQALVNNLTARLEPHQYLNNLGLYSSLPLRELVDELSQLETNVDAIHSQLNNAQTQKLSREVRKLRTDVDRMERSDAFNMKTVKEKLRYLKNSAESCKTIPTDFRGEDRHCLKGLITSISDPVMTQTSSYGKSYISGSWGQQAQMDSEGQADSYWIQPLVNSHIWGNTLRVYQTNEDFMASANHKDFTFAPSHTHANSIEGPSAVLYGEALYYHCYKSPDVCRYDLKTNAVKRVTLPGTGVGFSNKFPYCYYDCRANSDVDVEADERGLWAIYATVGNHGNIVLSRLLWDSETETLNVTQTWETTLFKKAVSNAFMVCGVMYATRYVDEYREEVFYAFDTATGKHDDSLALPMEKIAKGVASLSYNPVNKQIYMYNDAYLLAYKANF